MKKVLAMILVICLIAGFAYGQDKEWQTRNIGLVFKFQGLNDLNLNNFMGGIGAKFCFGMLAVRPVFIFGTTSLEADPIWDPAYVGDKGTISQFGFGADILMRLASGRVSPYIGFGGGYTSGSEKLEYEYDPTLQASADTDETTLTTLAVAACIGVEFFLFQNFSLSGEYRIGYESGSYKYTYTDVLMPSSNYTWESKGTSMGIATMGFIIATFYIK
jgi:opacity protein-like surface antigen